MLKIWMSENQNLMFGYVAGHRGLDGVRKREEDVGIGVWTVQRATRFSMIVVSRKSRELSRPPWQMSEEGTTTPG